MTTGSGSEIEAAKRRAEGARRELDSTLGALQLRLRPKSLATEAWDGVKEKSGDLAETALGAVRQRPGAVSLAVGAVVLFLARDPLKRAARKMLSGEEEKDGRVTTRIDTETNNYDPAAPLVEALPQEGAIR